MRDREKIDSRNIQSRTIIQQNSKAEFRSGLFSLWSWKASAYGNTSERQFYVKGVR